MMTFNAKRFCFIFCCFSSQLAALFSILGSYVKNGCVFWGSKRELSQIKWKSIWLFFKHGWIKLWENLQNKKVYEEKKI